MVNPYQNLQKLVMAQPMQAAMPDAASIAVEIPAQLNGDVLAAMEQVVFDENGNPILEEAVVEVKKVNHYENLAEKIDEDVLDKIGNEIVAAVESDIESRKPYYKKFVDGITALGINFDESAERSEVFGSITHPLLIEAATQFQARAMAELFPPDGPVKTRVLGESTPELVAQAQRVQDFMNYQLVYEDPLYYEESDQLLFMLPFSGSEFRKQYYDKSTNKIISRWVRNEDFIIHYGASSLEQCPRYAHRLRLEVNEIKRLQKVGHFRQIPLTDEATNEDNDVAEKIKKIDGIIVQTENDAGPRVLYEVHIDYDLPGYEEDISLPYIITVDSETRKIYSIYRNWSENDETRTKRIWFTHYKFLPGFGFYGFGLLHTIGSLGEVATRILQILLDAGAFSAVPGGFKTKDAKLPADIIIEPGVWKDVEATAEELARAFFTPNFSGPPETLFSLLGAITDLGRRFAATTEVMVGDAATTGPVGTTLALVEQGSKVFSGIHKRLHRALLREFQHIAQLNFEQLDETEYPFNVNGVEKTVFKTDFDGRVDVIPVSDPNIFSHAQRVAMAQAVFQIATQMPDVANRRKAAVSLLQAMRVPNIEEIFPEKAQAERADPVTEIVFASLGRPLRAYLDQNHQAHIMVHMSALQTQQVPPHAVPILQAHIAEHMAMAVYMQMQQMGIKLPPLNWQAEPHESMSVPLPVEFENMIAMQAAQMMQMMMQQMPPPQQQNAQQGNADKIMAAQIAAQTQKEINALNAQMKQQSDLIKAQTKQAETAANMQAQKEQQAIDYNKFITQLALEREKFMHERAMDIAEYRKELMEMQNRLKEEFRAMIDELKESKRGGE